MPNHYREAAVQLNSDQDSTSTPNSMDIIIIIINLTPFELKAMRVSYKSLKTRGKNLTIYIVG